MLTLEECRVLLGNPEINEEYEFCAGKKHTPPNKVLGFRRILKEEKFLQRQIKQAKEYGLPEDKMPTNYTYKMKKKLQKEFLRAPKNYPYDWFLGGIDSCQGDSGSPLWRNVKLVKCIKLSFALCIELVMPSCCFSLITQ